MSPSVAIAIGAALYALLSEWLGENPRIKAGSVYGLVLMALRWCYNRYFSDIGVNTRRTMLGVDDQVARFHREAEIRQFQDQLAAAAQVREELLQDPTVQDVQVQLLNNQVVLAIEYEPSTQQTGESLKLGGAIRITSPLALRQESAPPD